MISSKHVNIFFKIANLQKPDLTSEVSFLPRHPYQSEPTPHLQPLAPEAPLQWQWLPARVEPPPLCLEGVASYWETFVTFALRFFAKKTNHENIWYLLLKSWKWLYFVEKNIWNLTLDLMLEMFVQRWLDWYHTALVQHVFRDFEKRTRIRGSTLSPVKMIKWYLWFWKCVIWITDWYKWTLIWIILWFLIFHSGYPKLDQFQLERRPQLRCWDSSLFFSAFSIRSRQLFAWPSAWSQQKSDKSLPILQKLPIHVLQESLP